MAAITSTLPTPLTDEYVELPWHHAGAVKTGLRQRCAVHCGWLAELDPNDVERISGFVPGVKLQEIARKTDALSRQRRSPNRSLRRRRQPFWTNSGSRPEMIGNLEVRDGLPAIGRETRSSRGRFPMPGLHPPVGSPRPVSRLLCAVHVVGSDARTVGAGRSPTGCGSPTIRPDAASIRRAGRVAGRGTGAGLQVGGLRLGSPGAGAGPERRPLYGPIPWSWWLPASRLPGKTLQVASVCWLLAGWNRSAEFELALHDRAEFGLSRFSASRGLDELERAGLVSVGRIPGRSPSVTILDTDAASQ